jgi:hypothetical protein
VIERERPATHSADKLAIVGGDDDRGAAGVDLPQ